MHLCSINVQQRRQKYAVREKIVSSTINAGNTGQLHVKERNYNII